MSFQVIADFEKEIADFFGAPYAVAVDCCTHGLELCLRLHNITKITVPKRTYLSVPMLADKLNIDLEWSEDEWQLLLSNKQHNRCRCALGKGQLCSRTYVCKFSI